VERNHDPWVTFRFWVALTIAVFALRAVSQGTPFIWPGAIPGWVLLLMVTGVLLLALRALLFPGRVVPWREGEPGLWAEITADWRHRRRARGRRR
jgi:hypothetical protein